MKQKREEGSYDSGPKKIKTGILGKRGGYYDRDTNQLGEDVFVNTRESKKKKIDFSDIERKRIPMGSYLGYSNKTKKVDIIGIPTKKPGHLLGFDVSDNKAKKGEIITTDEFVENNDSTFITNTTVTLDKDGNTTMDKLLSNSTVARFTEGGEEDDYMQLDNDNVQEKVQKKIQDEDSMQIGEQKEEQKDTPVEEQKETSVEKEPLSLNVDETPSTVTDDPKTDTESTEVIVKEQVQEAIESTKSIPPSENAPKEKKAKEINEKEIYEQYISKLRQRLEEESDSVKSSGLFQEIKILVNEYKSLSSTPNTDTIIPTVGETTKLSESQEMDIVDSDGSPTNIKKVEKESITHSNETESKQLQNTEKAHNTLKQSEKSAAEKLSGTLSNVPVTSADTDGAMDVDPPASVDLYSESIDDQGKQTEEDVEMVEAGTNNEDKNNESINDLSNRLLGGDRNESVLDNTQMNVSSTSTSANLIEASNSEDIDIMDTTKDVVMTDVDDFMDIDQKEYKTRTPIILPDFIGGALKEAVIKYNTRQKYNKQAQEKLQKAIDDEKAKVEAEKIKVEKEKEDERIRLEKERNFRLDIGEKGGGNIPGFDESLQILIKMGFGDENTVNDIAYRTKIMEILRKKNKITDVKTSAPINRDEVFEETVGIVFSDIGTPGMMGTNPTGTPVFVPNNYIQDLVISQTEVASLTNAEAHRLREEMSPLWNEFKLSRLASGVREMERMPSRLLTSEYSNVREASAIRSEITQQDETFGNFMWWLLHYKFDTSRPKTWRNFLLYSAALGYNSLTQAQMNWIITGNKDGDLDIKTRFLDLNGEQGDPIDQYINVFGAELKYTSLLHLSSQIKGNVDPKEPFPAKNTSPSAAPIDNSIHPDGTSGIDRANQLQLEGIPNRLNNIPNPETSQRGNERISNVRVITIRNPNATPELNEGDEGYEPPFITQEVPDIGAGSKEAGARAEAAMADRLLLSTPAKLYAPIHAQACDRYLGSINYQRLSLSVERYMKSYSQHPWGPTDIDQMYQWNVYIMALYGQMLYAFVTDIGMQRTSPVFTMETPTGVTDEYMELNELMNELSKFQQSATDRASRISDTFGPDRSLDNQIASFEKEQTPEDRLQLLGSNVAIISTPSEPFPTDTNSSQGTTPSTTSTVESSTTETSSASSYSINNADIEHRNKLYKSFKR